MLPGDVEAMKEDAEALTQEVEAKIQDAEALTQDVEALTQDVEALVQDAEALIEDRTMTGEHPEYLLFLHNHNCSAKWWSRGGIFSYYCVTVGV